MGALDDKLRGFAQVLSWLQIQKSSKHFTNNQNVENEILTNTGAFTQMLIHVRCPCE